MRVLIADDQPKVRSALQILLTHQPEVSVVGEVDEAKDLVDQIHTNQPDLVLLDWELPGLSAIGSLTALRMEVPYLSVIALSVRPETRLEALNAGADGFVCKIDPPEQLVKALHSVSLKSKKRKDGLSQSWRGLGGIKDELPAPPWVVPNSGTNLEQELK